MDVYGTKSVGPPFFSHTISHSVEPPHSVVSRAIGLSWAASIKMDSHFGNSLYCIKTIGSTDKQTPLADLCINKVSFDLQVSNNEADSMNNDALSIFGSSVGVGISDRNLHSLLHYK